MKGDCTMSVRRTLAAVIVLGFAVTGCDYIVPPISFDTPTPAIKSQGWAAIVTNVTEASGALHVDLSIQNNTNDWSAVNVAASKASVTESSGKQSNCDKVFVGTSVFVNNGGWYLPAGFVMSGYTGGSADAPVTQALFVECAGVAKAPGEKLSVSFSYITGPWNYYVPSQGVNGTFNLDLDKIVTDTKYPVAATVAATVINKSDAAVEGINHCIVQLTGVARTDIGFEFAWKNENPGKYPTYLHIGNPPVIGSDGIMYGFYEAPNLADAPITPNADNGVNGEAEWTTDVAVPKDVTGFYILLPEESQQSKFFIDHVIDITDKSAITGTFPPATPTAGSGQSSSDTGAPAISATPSA
jgi:hypothetical protein